MKGKESSATIRLKLQETNKRTQTLQEGINEWLFLYKNENVIERTFDRIESTYLTHIVGSDLGIMQEQAITYKVLRRII